MDRTAEGEAIRTLEPAGGGDRLRVGPEALAAAGLSGPGYSLHDLAWDPERDRIAFTWFDGSGWGRIAIADEAGRVSVLPSPVLRDLWESGAVFSLPSSQFVWGEDGESGTFVAWDDDCGALYRISGLPSGSVLPASKPEPLSMSPACRSVFRPSPGFWLYTEFGEEFSQRLVVADSDARAVESLIFPQGRPPRVRWSSTGAAGRGAIVGWWNEPESATRVLFTWERDAVVEWRRERCEGDCAEPAALVSGKLLFIEGPPRGGRLVILDRPGAEPEPAGVGGVTELAAHAAGAVILTVRTEDDRAALWLLDPASFAHRPGLR